jgi:hypothetical protein
MGDLAAARVELGNKPIHVALTWRPSGGAGAGDLRCNGLCSAKALPERGSSGDCDRLCGCCLGLGCLLGIIAMHLEIPISPRPMRLSTLG